MTGLTRFIKSSLGAKFVMATTGIALVGFLVVHLAGNFNMFLGQKAMNDYALFLKRDVGKALWLLRFGLLGAVLLHILSAIRLVALNSEAKPQRYAVENYKSSTYASRTMRWSGLIVLSFIIYHLLHFTLGVTNPEHFALEWKGHHDVYNMTVLGFQNVIVSGFYIIAQVLLAMHLSHGISSLFQSLGLNNSSYRDFFKKVGPAIATALCIGFVSIPISVLLGFIKYVQN